MAARNHRPIPRPGEGLLGQVGHYQYETLGDDDFQRLIQALLARSLGHRVRAMPLNKADGGRDAVHGVVVFQVKFTGAPDAVDDKVTWLLAAIDGEEIKIRRLVARGCRDYVLATNVGGTGGLDRGTIDRLDKELTRRAAEWGLDHLTAWWRDDVDAQFAVAEPSTKLAFLRALPADEALAITLLNRSNDAERRDLALAAYLANQFDADNKVRFEQADLAGPTVERLFVDVAVASGTLDSPAHALLADLGAPAGKHEAGSDDQPVMGAARLLMQPAWRGNALIIGGPGQGKTTLLQYVCQVHRARHLGRDTYQQAIPQQHLKALVRVPFRIDLREYATWQGKAVAAPSSRKAGKEKKKKRQHDGVTFAIEVFLAEHISRLSGGMEFKVADLAALVAGRPVLMAFDGLDEVADLVRRHEVAAEIAAAAIRLQQNATDIVILVTTRPGAAIADVLDGEHFPVLHMQRLTPELRLAYLGRWAQQAGLQPEQVEELRHTFVEKQALPHVRELSSNPMQLAILLHLMQRRGILPEQRTELYSDYVKTFLDRESPKETVVRLHRPIVEDVHAYLAWHLQSESERGRSNGALTQKQLKKLLSEYLQDHGHPGQLVKQFFDAITGRVICLIERPNGIEFEVQPLREYFAARHLHEGAPLRGDKNTKDDRLDALLRRPYWSNVLRFFAGMLSKGEVRGLPSNLRTLRKSKPFDVLPTTRALAVQLLEDQVFIRQSAIPVRDAVDVALEGPGVILADDHLLSATGEVLTLGEGAGQAELVAHIQERLPGEQNPAAGRAMFSLLMAHSSTGTLRSEWNGQACANLSTWMSAAADLEALDSPGEAAVARLLSYERTRGDDDEPLSSVLLRGGSHCTDDRVLAACLTSLGNGIGGDGEVSRADTLVARLHKWSSPGRFYAHRASAPRVVAADPPVEPRRQGPIRRPAGGSIVRQKLATLQAAHDPANDWTVRDTWLTALDALRDLFGDCWLVREAVFTVPSSMLSQDEPPDISAGSRAESLLTWVRQARENAGDSAWWQGQLTSAVDDLSRRTCLLGLLLMSKAGVISVCAAELEQALTIVGARDAVALLETCRRQQDAASVRQLDLHSQLRTRRFKPDPLTALVLYDLCFEPTQAELAKHVMAGFQDLVGKNRQIALRTLDIARIHQSHTVAVTVLRGTRSFLPAGRIGDRLKIKKLTGAQAQNILAQPEQWPTDIVRLAADAVLASLSGLPALADVAATDGWFD